MTASGEALHMLLTSDVPGSALVLVEPDGSMSSAAHLEAIALLPGSFNPLHDGHRLLAAAAREQAGREVIFELSVTNVDKPPLIADEVTHRLAQFRGQARVLLSRAPRFVEKARLLPGSTFIVGWDTFTRLLEPRYYGDAEAMRAALAEIGGRGCRFLVAGRAQGSVFRTLADTPIPEAFTALFEPIPESRFRLDISAMALRDGL